MNTATAGAVMTDVLLRELIAEVRGLRADLVRSQPAVSLSRADRALLGRPLPAIGGVFANFLFLRGP